MKAILFDLDGTIIDSSEGVTKSVQHALKHFGIDEPDLKKLNVFIGPPLVESFPKNYGFSKEQTQEAIAIYRERYKPIGMLECQLYDGVAECLKKLHEMGYKISVASSKPEPFCKKILEHFGILDLFDEVVGATEDGRIDTKEEVLQELLRRWSDIALEDMCLIGDTIYDIEGANLVGIKSVGVSYGFGNLDEMLNAGALFICDSMEEIPKRISEVFA